MIKTLKTIEITGNGVVDMAGALALLNVDANQGQLGLVIRTTGTTTATVKLQHSFMETAPNFAAAASGVNSWSYLSSLNLSTGAIVAGATGYAFAGADGVFHIAPNFDSTKWLSLETSGYVQGRIFVDIVSID